MKMEIIEIFLILFGFGLGWIFGVILSKMIEYKNKLKEYEKKGD